MSLIDKLLQMDKAKLMAMPTKEVEFERLSNLLNESFKVKCKAIDGERYADIQRSAVDLNKKGGLRDINLFEMQVLTVIDGVVEPSLKDERLLGYFGCVTPKELVKKLFLAGEIAELSNVITELSGYDKDEDEEELKKQ
nr:XkdN-like protein [uncultured Cellulosilyticum sp.]